MISNLSKMSHKSNESDDEFLSSDHIGSPLIDDGGFGGSIDDHIVLKKGPWTSVEDAILVDYVRKHGEGNWSSVQKHSGLSRCGKSCRLRWANHLRPNLKKGSFTPEEERLIIELHSKMGNKWARMAANLPGRTDNEIKNYWNTRIKRRQRAGLPLYPPELCLEALNESKENNKFPSENVPHNIVHSNRHEMPDDMFDGLKGDYGGSAYAAELCDVSSHSMPTKGLGSSQYTTSPQPIVRRQKRTRHSAEALSWCGNRTRNESETIDLIPDGIGGNMVTQSVGLSFPYNPDPVTRDFSLFSDRQGNHSLSNGKFSASEPADGVVKLELPSLQYPDADFSTWDSSPAVMLESMDAFIQSPPSGTLQTGCHSPQNSGLLDALLNEANTRKSVKGQLFSKRLNSYVITPMDISGSGLDLHETKQEETADSTIATRNAPALDTCETKTANYGNSGAALSSDCDAANLFRSMLDDYTHAEAFPGKSLKPEVAAHTWTCDGQTREPSTQFDRLRPDALLGSCWLGQNVVCPKDQAIPPHAMEADFGGLSNDYWHTAYGSALSQGWGFGSCSWNNMPAACQMSDLP